MKMHNASPPSQHVESLINTTAFHFGLGTSPAVITNTIRATAGARTPVQANA